MAEEYTFKEVVVPQTAAATKAALEDAKKNPVSQVTTRQTVTLSLTFDGVKFEPKVLYEALDAKYGTVSSQKDSTARKQYHWRISP